MWPISREIHGRTKVGWLQFPFGIGKVSSQIELQIGSIDTVVQ